MQQDLAFGLAPDQADRQGFSQLAPGRFVADAAVEAGPQDVELGFLWGPGCYADWPRILAVYSSKYRHIEAA